MGVVVDGTTARFTPSSQNANTSLKDPTYSLYSSDPNTKSNDTTVPLGIKSNSSTAASYVVWTANAVRSGSPGLPTAVLEPSLRFVPEIAVMFPVDMIR